MAELGQIRLRMGNLAGAEKAFQEARELGWDPNPGWALLQLALGDVEGAGDSIPRLAGEPACSGVA
jgi:cytochrome c-type biogenesis protein CcmH/NrfG